MTTSKTSKNAPKNGSATSPSPKPAKPPKPPKPSENKVAKSLETAYNGAYAYDSSADQWRHFKDGVWKPIKDLKIHETIRRSIDEHFSPDFNSNFVAGVAKLLKGMMAYDSWDNAVSPNKIPFPNGVLNLETMQFTSGHDPMNCFTWQLPYQYDPNATCGPVLTWLEDAVGGDKTVVEIIRAFFNATLTGRSDLQRFLEIDGAAGTGKGTLTRLLNDLIGVNNVYTTTLRQLEENRFETASARGRRLLQIGDADRFGGIPNVLKAITGNDLVRYEKKNLQQGDGFTFDGMVLIVANRSVSFQDDSNAIHRRRITVRLDKVVPASQRRDLTTEFKKYIPGVLNWCLEMAKEDVENVLRNTERFSVGAAEGKRQSIMENHPLAPWLDACAEFDENSLVNVGKFFKDSTGHIEHADEYLYPNYYRYCESAKIKNPLSLNKFSTLLEELNVNILGLGDDFGKRRDGQDGIRGIHFKGIRLCDAPRVSFIEHAFKSLAKPQETPTPPTPTEVDRAIDMIISDIRTHGGEPYQKDYLKDVLNNSGDNPFALAMNFHANLKNGYGLEWSIRTFEKAAGLEF